MLIALDIGNTHVTCGGFNGDDMVFVASIATDDRQTGEQYAIALRDIFSLYGVDAARIDGAVLCSVAPGVTPAVQRALALVLSCEVLTVSTGTRTGLNIKLDQPKALGSDLVANAVWAMQRGQMPCVAVDLGTATTFTVLDQNGVLTGTVIAAGVRISLDALKQRAAQLPLVRIEAPSGGVLGRNTVDAMKSGALYGAAAMIDGIVDRIGAALGQTPYVLLSGGVAPLIAPHLRIAATYEPYLTLRGLTAIWRRNHKGDAK